MPTWLSRVSVLTPRQVLWLASRFHVSALLLTDETLDVDSAQSLSEAGVS